MAAANTVLFPYEEWGSWHHSGKEELSIRASHLLLSHYGWTPVRFSGILTDMDMILPEIQQRRARRALSLQEIPDEVLARLLEAATLSASCFNNQPWRFVVLKKGYGIEHGQARLAQGNYWAQTAPVIVGVATLADYDCDLDDGRQYALFDCGMAVQNLQIQAQHEGLVAHPVAGFKAAELKDDLGIPPDHILITLVVIGYPGTDNILNEKHQELECSERVRKNVDEVVFYGSWPAQTQPAE